MDQAKVIAIAKEYLSFLAENKVDVQSVYVFGSATKGLFTDDSDIDLALIFEDLPNSFLMQIELMKLGRLVDTRIEPHPFDDQDFNLTNPFAGEIIRTGIRIV